MDDDIPDSYLRKLQEYWAAFYYGVEVKILEHQIDVPSIIEEKHIKSRIRKDTGKVQYLATDLLDIISEEYLPEDGYCSIGIINKDLYPKPGWSFVFGCSRLKRRTGIFSFARYDPKFTSKEEGREAANHKDIYPNRIRIDEKDEELQKLIMYRACKTMTHEIGHMFGIRHWIYHEWVMNGTNKMEEADLKPLLLWPICLRKLHYAIGFDIKERYQKLHSVVELEFKGNTYFDPYKGSIATILSWIPSYINEEVLETAYQSCSKMLTNSNFSSDNDESTILIKDKRHGKAIGKRIDQHTKPK